MCGSNHQATQNGMQTDASEFISATGTISIDHQMMCDIVVKFFFSVKPGSVAGFCFADKGDFWLRDNMRKVLQGCTSVQFFNDHPMTVAFVVDFFYGVKPGGVAGLCSADKGDLWM